MIETIRKFLRLGFNTNLGYTIIKIIYNYDGEPYIGYILAKNYTIFWLRGYDRIGMFTDRESLDKYLDLNQILISN